MRELISQFREMLKNKTNSNICEFLLAFVLLLLFVWPLLGFIMSILIFIKSLFQNGIPKLNNKRLKFLILIPFIIGFISLLLDIYFYEINIKHYRRLFPFLIFPTILYNYKIDFSNFKKYYIFFSSGLALFLILFALVSSKVISPTTPSNSIYMDGFLNIIKAHPSYISIYFIIAIIFIEDRLSKSNLFALTILVVAIFLSASKINLIFLLLYTIIFILMKGVYKYFIYLTIMLSLLGLFSKLTTNGHNYDPFSRVMVLVDYLKEGSKDDSTNGRVIVWKNATKLISAKPITGYGMSYGHYLIQNSPNNEEKQLNAHNQYLQHYINAGLLGFLGLLIYMFYPITMDSGENSLVIVSIILLFSLNMLVENLLDRRWGIMLVSFFMSLIYLVLLQNNVKNGFKTLSE